MAAYLNSRHLDQTLGPSWSPGPLSLSACQREGETSILPQKKKKKKQRWGELLCYNEDTERHAEILLSY